MGYKEDVKKLKDLMTKNNIDENDTEIIDKKISKISLVFGVIIGMIITSSFYALKILLKSSLMVLCTFLVFDVFIVFNSDYMIFNNEYWSNFDYFLSLYLIFLMIYDIKDIS